MRVLFVLGYFPKLSETFILNQIIALKDLGVQLDIIALENPNESKIQREITDYKLLNHVTYLTMPKNILYRFIKSFLIISTSMSLNQLKNNLLAMNIFKYGFLALSCRLLFFNKLVNNEYDIIHCHFGNNGIFGDYITNIRKAKKSLVSFHGYDVNRKSDNQYLSILPKTNCYYTANTNYTKEKLLNLGFLDERISILPESLQLNKFSINVNRRHQNKIPVLLTVGRLVEKKGHEFGLHALSKLKKQHQKFIYYIAGSGPLEDSLKSLSKKLNLEKDVVFLGEVTQDEVIDLYNKTDIFILPCVTAKNGDKEGQALVLQEAQLSGIPVISTIHNGIPEGVKDKLSGYLVEEKDIVTLAARIKELLENSKKRHSMGEQGKIFVKMKYGHIVLAKKLIQIYQTILKDSSTRHIK